MPTNKGSFITLISALAIFAANATAGDAPDLAMKRLQSGNTRFVAGTSQHANTGADRIDDTAKNGQHPFATVITCSDSRVPVERVFDQGVGDVFVIRVAGNVCDTDEVGSIEYGVDHLGTPLLVVLGHTGCGAVTAVVTGAELHGSIPPLVDNIKPAVATAQASFPQLHGKALVPQAVTANVWQSIDDLFKTSPATRKRVEAGTLKVVGAVYDITDGSVKWLGLHADQGRLLAYTGGPSHVAEGGHAAAPANDGQAESEFTAGAVEAKHNPAKAIAFLKEGNERFVTGNSIRPHSGVERFRQAGTENQGNHAYATVITCSDSRVPVEELFDAGVMDIFVIRVAGNVCDTDEIGSIEYGLAHVNTPVLVVLGHTQCGAVTAVTHAILGTGHPLERNIPPLVDNIQPAVERAMAKHAQVKGDAIIPFGIEENVWQGIEDLYLESPATRNLVNSGKVKVVGAIYDVATGRINWLPENKPAQILANVEANPKRAMNAMAASGHGDEHAASSTGDGHAAATHTATVVQAEPITLIGQAKLDQLDKARHRTFHAAAISMSLPEQGMSLLWKILIGLAAIAGAGGLLIKSGALGRMGVATKMYGGFAAIVALGVAGGWFGYHALDQVSKQSELALATLELDVMVGEINSLQDKFILIGIEDRERGEELLKEHKTLTKEYYAAFNSIRTSFDLDDAERAALASIEESTKKYERVFAEVTEKFHEIEEYKEKLDELGEQVDEQLAHVVHEHEADLAEMQSAGASTVKIALQTELVEKLVECELLALRVSHNEVEFLLDKKIERVTAMEQQLGQLRGELKVVEALIPECAKDKSEETADLATLAKVEHELDQYQELVAKVVEDELIVAADLIDCNQDLKVIEHTAAALAERAEHVAVATRDESHQAALGLMAIVAVAGSLFAFFITRGITTPLNRIIAGLNEGADQVSDAAGQVSTASQQLAEGASEQASSLEEASSSLEQMAAMTRTNAENAKQANKLSGQARDAAQNGNQTMQQLDAAMGGINESSGKIGKIIKVIEEIAFQTNLLALNAAVEAARAGEHGKGFAVVADEVRNLAQRAAKAAQETTGLIEESTDSAKQGTNVASEVGKALGAIAGDVTKVTDLIEGITKASEEQAQGVEQVNLAVSQMDRVTQQNAAGAEESASAAEQLSAQAETVKGMVDQLRSVVRGHGSAGSLSSRAAPTGVALVTKSADSDQIATGRALPHDFSAAANSVTGKSAGKKMPKKEHAETLGDF